MMMTSDNHQITKHLLFSWLDAYERVIVNRYFQHTKGVIDEACYFAVEEFTERLYVAGKIDQIRGREFSTIEQCVHHHIDNLVSAGMFSENNRPHLREDENDSRVVFIDIPACDYLEPCKKSFDEHSYSGSNFPCQRIGCFVGSVRKYIKEDILSEEKRKDVTYFLTQIHSMDGCRGIIVVNEGFLLRTLKSHHLAETNPKED